MYVDWWSESSIYTLSAYELFSNTPPVADAGGPYSGDEGSAIGLDGSGSTDDSAITQYEWDCDSDGTYDVTSASATGSTCTYADNDNFTVTLRVSDAAGLTDTDTAAVTVNNAAPQLSIADASLDASDGSFSVPVVFDSAGAEIASVGFSLDYDACLSFDATDSDSDGTPDAISGLPAGFASSFVADASDTDGELDISLYDDTQPIGSLSDGTLLTVEFQVVAGCVTTDGSTTTAAVIDFSDDPAASFGDPSAADVDGSSSGGTFTLSFNGTPTNISFSGGASISLDENTAAGTTVGTFSTADPDGGDSHTYELVAGSGDDDNAAFVFDGNALKIVTPPDFESKSSLTIRIRTTDNGGLNGSFEKVFVVTVNDIYEAPAGVSFNSGGDGSGGDDGDPNTLDIDENKPAGSVLAILGPTNPDDGSSYTFTLVTGTGDDDNGSFEIVDGELRATGPLDAEKPGGYTIRVQITDDQGNSYEQVIVVQVNNVYEAPAGIDFDASGGGDDGDPNTLDLDENKPAGSTLADFAPANPNDGSSYTYELVSGDGDDDNGSFTFDGSELQSSEALDAEKPGGYTIRVQITDDQGNSYIQVFTVLANDKNDAPVAQNDAVDPRATVVVGTASLDIDVLDNDSDQDNDPLTVDALTQPGAGTATDNNSHITFTGPDSNGTASFTYQATDSSLNSASATVTVSHVQNDARGDCNGSGSVTAADFTAVVLEIFDSGDDPQVGNKPAWWRIYAGGFGGSPLGCDANASRNGASNSSDSVTAADIICSVLVFFGYTDCTQPTVAAQATTVATLAAPQALAAQTGSGVDVPLSLESGGNPIAAAAFSLRLDPAVVNFDASDGNGDGLPDGVTIHAPASMVRTVLWNAESSQLDIALYGVSVPVPTLNDGTLAVVRLAVAADAPAGSTPLVFERVSLGDAQGQDVTAQSVDGALAVVSAQTNHLFLPSVTR